jgi:hypothetical protein
VSQSLIQAFFQTKKFETLQEEFGCQQLRQKHFSIKMLQWYHFLLACQPKKDYLLVVFTGPEPIFAFFFLAVWDLNSVPHAY